MHRISSVLYCTFFAIILYPLTACAQSRVPDTKIYTVGEGWASNSVNAVIFRKNSLATFQDTQYIAWYDQDGYVMLGKRKIGTDAWETRKTPYQGNVSDAHNTISIMVDGKGYLHMSWDHHGNPLRYCRSKAPGSLEMSEEMPMTGRHEENVTYPEFYSMPDGKLLFFYRDGASGRGNLVINSYDAEAQQWTQLHSNLVSGEGERNAYWQACADEEGTLHLSWVWRESANVASNHDLCYARSTDSGRTWQQSTGEQYALPITASSAEYAWKIPQNSELINQTSMTTDSRGMPLIATYWRDSTTDVPQFRVVYLDGQDWKMQNLGFRKTAFTLSGAGTKRIPISRPQIVADSKNNSTAAYVIFRDEARGNCVSVAICEDLSQDTWKLKDLATGDYGSWEPTYDTELWKQQGILDIFLQKVTQIDGEGKANVPPQPVQVLEWLPE